MNLSTISITTLLLASFGMTSAFADGPGPHRRAAPLVDLIRESTAQFRDVGNAIAAGYGPGACVSGANGGAMGVHFVNPGLLFDGMLDPSTPEVLIYEPLGGGRFRLAGVEFLTIADVWAATNAGAPAVLEGHLLNYAGAPNRYGLPPYHEIHVWAWKHNPSGTFADWNPNVSCDSFDPQAAPVSASH